MNKKISKVLVGSPIYEKMDYCIERFLKAMKELDYEDYDLLIVDNSKNKNFFERLRNEEKIIYVQNNSNEENNMKRLIESRNLIIKYARENNYDFILMMDSDVIPPKGIIKSLIKEDKDIISGLYFSYFRFGGELKICPVAWRILKKEEFEIAKKQGDIPNDYKYHGDLQTILREEDIKSEKPIEATIISGGCMLIKRKVFEKITYEEFYSDKNELLTDENYFLMEARTRGFQIYCHTRVRCTHLIKGKKINAVNN